MGGAPDLFEAVAWGDRIAPQSEIPRDLPVHDPRIEAPARLSSTGLERPVARPKTQPQIAAVAPAPMPGDSFGGLADALEPEAIDVDADPVGAAPLDELDGLLEIFDGAPQGAPSTVVTPRPAAPTIEDSVTRSMPSVAARAAEEAPTLALPAVPRRATPVAVPPVQLAPPPPAATVAPPRRPTPVAAPIPRPRPAAPSRAPVDFPAPGDAAESAQLVTVDEADGPLLSRVAPRVDDDAPRRGRGAPVVWIALTLMLGGGLAWVVATQTDLLSGDLIASRNAAVLAEAEREVAEKQAEIDAKKNEYGTIELDTEPKGARVFELRDGPEAVFTNLPVDHEYQVLVTAPGFEPRVRLVKGSELGAPVIVDLDPVAAGATASAIPDERPPKVVETPGKETATLTLRSNTAGAQLGLLVGFTPGVKVLDVDVRATHRFFVVLAGHAPQEVTVKGRHFEEASGGLSFHDTVKLEPAAIAPAGAAPAGAAAPTDDDDADDDVVVVDDAPVAAAAPSKPAAPTKKKKKKKKKKRR